MYFLLLCIPRALINPFCKLEKGGHEYTPLPINRRWYSPIDSLAGSGEDGGRLSIDSDGSLLKALSEGCFLIPIWSRAGALGPCFISIKMRCVAHMGAFRAQDPKV